MKLGNQIADFIGNGGLEAKWIYSGGAVQDSLYYQHLPTSYDTFEPEFKAVIDFAREANMLIPENFICKKMNAILKHMKDNGVWAKMYQYYNFMSTYDTRNGFGRIDWKNPSTATLGTIDTTDNVFMGELGWYSTFYSSTFTNASAFAGTWTHDMYPDKMNAGGYGAYFYRRPNVQAWGAGWLGYSSRRSFYPRVTTSGANGRMDMYAKDGSKPIDTGWHWNTSKQLIHHQYEAGNVEKWYKNSTARINRTINTTFDTSNPLRCRLSAPAVCLYASDTLTTGEMTTIQQAHDFHILPWHPSEEYGFAAFYDNTDSNLFTLNGSEITGWTDYTGNHNLARAFSTGPNYVADYFATGKHAVYFPSPVVTALNLKATNPLPIPGNSISIFYGANAPNQDHRIVDLRGRGLGGSLTGLQIKHWANGGNSSVVHDDFDNSGGYFARGTTSLDNGAHGTVVSGNRPTIAINNYRGTGFNNVGDITTITPTSDQFIVGGPFPITIGGAANNVDELDLTQCFEGHVGPIVIFANQIGYHEALKVMAMINWRMNRQTAIYANHPYQYINPLP